MTSSEELDYIESVTPMIVDLARRYQTNDAYRQELIQDGKIGALAAARKFDLSKGVKYSTWARPCINNCMLKALRENLPLYVSEKSYYNLPASEHGIFHPEMLTDQDNFLPSDAAADPDSWWMCGKLRECLLQMSDRDFKIVTWYFGIDCDEIPTEKIATSMGCTQQNVRWHLRNILAKLNKMMTS